MQAIPMLFAFVPLVWLLPGSGEQKPKPKPPFPKSEAKWKIRGRIRAQFFKSVLDRSLRWRAPGVVVFIEGAGKRWSFPRPTEHVDVLVRKDGRIVPPMVCARTLQQIRLDCRQRGVTILKSKQTEKGMSLSRHWMQTAVTLYCEKSASLELEVQGIAKFRTPVRVFDHPLFCVVDAEGAFELPEVPPGRYVVRAIHETLGAAQVELEIKDKQPGPITKLFTPKTRVRRKKRARASARRIR